MVLCGFTKPKLSWLRRCKYWVPREVADPSNVQHAMVSRSVTGTVKMDAGHSSFYSKQGIVSMNERRSSAGDRTSSGSSVIKVKKMTKIYEGSTKFPKLEECAHFHYDIVEISTIKVRLQEEDQENIHRGESFSEEGGTPRDISAEHYFFIQVKSQDQTWTIRRNFQDLRMLDRQLHSCIYDRKYSLLLELRELTLQHAHLQDVRKDIALYLQRFSSIAGNMINCGPILSWFEMDNRGNRLIVTDDSAINTPAIAAAHVTKRYMSQAPDEISFEVGDIISIIDMPPDKESVWWRGKRNFEVGFFPCECVEIIKEIVPDAMTSKIPQTPPKAVLRKRGKLISFLRTFFTQRPARAQLQRSGIVKERVFGCDLGENLLNSGLEVPLILTTCAEAIEEKGIADGIYRLSGVASNIQKLRVEFDEEQVPNLSEDIFLQDIHSISSVLKAYFRELPNPLLTYALYDKFASAIQDEENRLLRIHDVIQQLPPPHYRTAKYLLQHLHRVSSFSKETGMHVKNLAIVWAPNLLRSKELEQQFTSAAALEGVCIQAIVTEFLISYVDVLFSDTFNNIGTGGTGGRRPRPKSLAISTPTKLLSLEEARERALANSPQQKFIEVGGGPSNLPDYHTVIDMPNKKKGSGKERKSGWRALFSRSRTSSWRNSKDSSIPISELPDVTTRRPISPASAEGNSRFFPDDQWRKHLRAVRSFDSLVSGGNRLSGLINQDEATTIINPYTDEFDGTRAATVDRLTRGDSGRGSKKRSISCDDYTYQGSITTSTASRPASDGSFVEVFLPTEESDNSRHSMGYYYTEPRIRSTSEEPLDSAPPVPSRASRPSKGSTVSSQEKALPGFPDNVDQSHAADHYLCSPPADPKRSRPMDYTTDEVVPVEERSQKASKKSKNKLVSPAGKKKKKAPPPPVAAAPVEQPVAYKASSPLSPPRLAVDRRRPVTQLEGYEEIEMHGVEGTSCPQVPYQDPAPHEAFHQEPDFSVAANSGPEQREVHTHHDLSHEGRVPEAQQKSQDFYYNPTLTQPKDAISEVSDSLPTSPIISQMDIANEISKSLDNIMHGGLELSRTPATDDYVSLEEREVVDHPPHPSPHASSASDYNPISSNTGSSGDNTLTADTQFSSMASINSDPNELIHPQTDSFIPQCNKYSSDSDNVLVGDNHLESRHSPSPGTESDYVCSPPCLSPVIPFNELALSSSDMASDEASYNQHRDSDSFPHHIPAGPLPSHHHQISNEDLHLRSNSPEPMLKAQLGHIVTSSTENLVQEAEVRPVAAAERMLAGQPDPPRFVTEHSQDSNDHQVLAGEGYLADRSNSTSPTQALSHHKQSKHSPDTEAERMVSLQESPVRTPVSPGKHGHGSDMEMVFHMDGFSDRGARSDSADNLSMSCDSCDELYDKKVSKFDRTESFEQLSSSGEFLHDSSSLQPGPLYTSTDGTAQQSLDDLLDECQPNVKQTKSRNQAQRNKSIKELMSKFETSSPSNSPPRETTKLKPSPRAKTSKSSQGTPEMDSPKTFDSGMAKSPEVLSMDISPASCSVDSVKVMTLRPCAEEKEAVTVVEPSSPKVLDKVKRFEIHTSMDSLQKAGSYLSDRKNSVPNTEDLAAVVNQVDQDKHSPQSIDEPQPFLLRKPKSQTVQNLSSDKKIVIVETTPAAAPLPPVEKDSDLDKPLSLADRMRKFQTGSGSDLPDHHTSSDPATEQRQSRESLGARLKRLSEQRKMYEEPENLPKSWRPDDHPHTQVKEVKPELPYKAKKEKTTNNQATRQGSFVTRPASASREDLSNVGLTSSEGDLQAKAALSQRKKLFETSNSKDQKDNSVRKEQENIAVKNQSLNSNSMKPPVASQPASTTQDKAAMADKVKQLASKTVVVEAISKDKTTQAVPKPLPCKPTVQTKEEKARVNVKGLSQMFEKH